ncbi:MAG: FAD-dependent oxidoreductase [Pseudomonadota bacterium]
MPFEAVATAPKRIAVIGAGISGMGAAHLLADHHHVVLYEAEGRLGGHARTKIAGKRGDQPVDTGFIVFNEPNYPHLTSLFTRLGVARSDSSMSFGTSIRGGWLEYGLQGAPSLFAQRRNVARPAYLRMIRDILHFNANAEAQVKATPGLAIGDLIARLGLGPWFRDYYLTPFSGAIWSTPVDRILDFPAHAMVQFFRNHALMSATGQHQWYTVTGGSQEYVGRLGSALQGQGVEIRLSSPIAAVRRWPGGADVRAQGGDWESFDEVIFACHSDQAMALLSDADQAENATVGAIRYQPNEVVLHADASIMPKRKACWASWNYTEPATGRPDRIGVTYWMNSLQPIPMDDPLFVTLNGTDRIREELIHDVTTLAHPLYDQAAIAAQGQVAARNGARNTWFCGAWMKNGFHEDGLSSAVDVAEAILREGVTQVAAE